jgi:hypothetical protein
MNSFAHVEHYREELRRRSFRRLDDGGLEEMKTRVRSALQCVGVPDGYPNRRIEAFFGMLLEERVPNDVADEFCQRYVYELIVN